MGRTKDLLISMMEEIDNDINMCDEGLQSYLHVWAEIHDMEKYVVEKKAQIKEACADQVYPGAMAGGYSFEVRTGKRNYDFSDLEDWNDANNKKKAIEQKYKNASRIAEGGLVMVDEHGEIPELPKVKYSDDSIVLKLKK